jgi:hypothetical protein
MLFSLYDATAMLLLLALLITTIYILGSIERPIRSGTDSNAQNSFHHGYSIDPFLYLLLKV